MNPRIVAFVAVFTVIAGAILAWYAFKPTDEVLGSLAITAYVEPTVDTKRDCVRRLTLVLTVRNTADKPATIKSVRFLVGKRAGFNAGVSERRIGADKQLVLRFEVSRTYARIRAQRLGRAITHIELRDGLGFRYRRPVGLNTGARICTQ